MKENIDDIIKEMRQIRPDCDDCISNHVCDYLSSFADRIEAVCKRYEKKYEYAVEFFDLCGKWEVYKNGLTEDEARKLSSEKWARPHRIVCREVGEWENVC